MAFTSHGHAQGILLQQLLMHQLRQYWKPRNNGPLLKSYKVHIRRLLGRDIKPGHCRLLPVWIIVFGI